MKYRYICLLSFMIPILPYFMPTSNAYGFSRLLNYCWFGLCFLLILILIGLILKDVFQASSFTKSKSEHSSKSKNAYKPKILLAVFLSFFTYLFADNLFEFWQIRKMERVVEANNLFNKSIDEVPDELLQQYNKNSRWFLINYSEIFPSKNLGIAKVYYRKDLLFEDWDCHLYYSKERPDLMNFQFIKEGQKGYNWYRWCNY